MPHGPRVVPPPVDAALRAAYSVVPGVPPPRTTRYGPRPVRAGAWTPRAPSRPLAAPAQ